MRICLLCKLIYYRTKQIVIQRRADPGQADIKYSGAFYF
jgi:hypothetical protein